MHLRPFEKMLLEKKPTTDCVTQFLMNLNPSGEWPKVDTTNLYQSISDLYVYNWSIKLTHIATLIQTALTQF